MAGQILFVCTGNTCRSPMAEGLARRLIADGALGVDDGSWPVASAGAWAGIGAPAPPEAASGEAAAASAREAGST